MKTLLAILFSVFFLIQNADARCRCMCTDPNGKESTIGHLANSSDCREACQNAGLELMFCEKITSEYGPSRQATFGDSLGLSWAPAAVADDCEALQKCRSECNTQFPDSQRRFQRCVRRCGDPRKVCDR